MDETEREAFYDAEVAPVLSDLSKRCLKNGLSFLAVVEWEPGETGRTTALNVPRGFGMSVLEVAARTGDNVDSLIMALMKHAREHGHSSMCLSQLGVPTQPAE